MQYKYTHTLPVTGTQTQTQTESQTSGFRPDFDFLARSQTDLRHRTVRIRPRRILYKTYIGDLKNSECPMNKPKPCSCATGSENTLIDGLCVLLQLAASGTHRGGWGLSPFTTPGREIKFGPDVCAMSCGVISAGVVESVCSCFCFSKLRCSCVFYLFCDGLCCLHLSNKT